MVRPSCIPTFSHALLALSIVGSAVLPSCTKEVPAELVDSDNDSIPDQSEDRDQDGVVDPGETDPTSDDTDGDGIPDDKEVQTLACAQTNDRPFEVRDVPGADAMIMVDARVSVFSMVRTRDNRAPGAVLSDPALGVTAVVVGKRPASGVATPSAQRDYEQRQSLSQLGRIVGQRNRAFTTVEGFAGEQAIFQIRASAPVTVEDATNVLASELLGGVQLTGTLATGAGPASADLTVQLLTIYRSAGRVVIVAAIATGDEPTSDQSIRLDELTDGTNVARHGSFTRHVCDGFLAKRAAFADIIWVVDDSGSMEDDQMAVRAAANAMEEVLALGDVDFRLGVARTFAQSQGREPRRGRLEGNGFTSDVERFKRDIVVGADGGWEPGLETGILAIDRLLPRTAEGSGVDANKLREGAATIIIHMSDERDQTVECAACGQCDAQEGEGTFCTAPEGDRVIDMFTAEYRARDAVTFAIVGDLPNGCQQTSTREDFEPGQGYVEVANATGGRFGSLCGDMRQNLEDVARAATGIVSSYELSAIPASASLKVAIGPPGMGRLVPRSRTSGFDYDATTNRIIFYGDGRPNEGDEIFVGYRRWDWANNPATPGDGCDLCDVLTFCDPESDLVDCGPVCGEEVCDPGLACLPDTAECGDPADVPLPGSEECGTCDAGLVCDPSSGDCVVPCEDSGCSAPMYCNENTHLCQIPDF